MSSVAKKQPTILDCISGWLSVACREPECGLLVDVIWLREDLTSPDDVRFCPDHALARVPPLERAATRQALQRVQRAHAILALQHPITRRALRVDVLPLPFPPTLFGFRWPERVNGCDIDLFAVRGFSCASVEDLETDPDLANLPIYRPEPLGTEFFTPTPREARTRPPFVEHYEEQEPIWLSSVIVELAFTATLPTKPLAPRVVSWQALDPSGNYAQMQIGIGAEELTGAEERRLRGALEEFAREKRSPGRKPGEIEEVCADFKANLPDAIRIARDKLGRDGEPRNRDLRQHELAAALGVSVATVQNRIEDCKIPWKTIKRRIGGHTISRSSP